MSNEMIQKRNEMKDQYVNKLHTDERTVDKAFKLLGLKEYFQPFKIHVSGREMVSFEMEDGERRYINFFVKLLHINVHDLKFNKLIKFDIVDDYGEVTKTYPLEDVFDLIQLVKKGIVTVRGIDFEPFLGERYFYVYYNPVKCEYIDKNWKIFVDDEFDQFNIRKDNVYQCYSFCDEEWNMRIERFKKALQSS